MYVTHYSSVMESSLPQQILYDTTSKCLTEAGQLYISSYFMNTLVPSDNQFILIGKYTGCPVSTLKKKFRVMLQKLPTLPTSTYEHSRISNAIDFLNTLTTDEAIVLKAQFMPTHTYEPFINPTHVNTAITVDEISSFTSHEIHDGKFLHDFMTCLVPANHLNQPSEHFSIIEIKSATKCSTLQSVNKLYIPHHYICLRARLSTFPPALSEDGVHVSRLCSQNGCIRDEHIVVESASISSCRQKCDGIILLLRPCGPTTPKRIVMIKPCRHGDQHPDADGDFLRYSCRRMRVMVMSEASMAYFDNIHRNSSS